MKPILILKTGSAPAAIAASHGDFEQWFQQALNSQDHAVDIHVIDARQWASAAQASAVNTQDFAGIVVTGSPAMVSHQEPWSEVTAQWLQRAVAMEIPTLGVCYGHQLLAYALGGSVGPNPYGYHVGTTTIELAQAGHHDALLKAFAQTPHAQVTHMERVLSLPEGAEVLATTAADPHHAVRFGSCAWGTQFHPEFSAAVTQSYVDERHAEIRASGLDPQQVRAQVTETPAGVALMQAFLQQCLQHAQVTASVTA
jgi:GMP synthase (glutamine-hydrolysing)